MQRVFGLRALVRAAALGVVAAAVSGCAMQGKTTWQPYPTPDRSYEALVGDQRSLYMHDLIYLDEAGEERSLSDHRGKVVLVHYWASWCPKCREEMQSLQQLEDAIDDSDNLSILVLNALEPYEDGANWARQNGINLALNRRSGAALDSNDLLPNGSYSIDDVPKTFVISREGLVVARYDKPRHWEDFDSAIEMLMAHREYHLPDTFHSKTVVAGHGANFDARVRPIAAQDRLHELVLQIDPTPGTSLSSDHGIRISPRENDKIAWRTDVPIKLVGDGVFIEQTQIVPMEFVANSITPVEVDVHYGVCKGNGVCTDAHQLISLKP